MGVWVDFSISRVGVGAPGGPAGGGYATAPGRGGDLSPGSWKRLNLQRRVDWLHGRVHLARDWPDGSLGGPRDRRRAPPDAANRQSARGRRTGRPKCDSPSRETTPVRVFFCVSTLEGQQQPEQLPSCRFAPRHDPM